LDLAFSVRPSDGYAFSFFQYLNDDGLGLGFYELFDASSNNLGERVFAFTLEDGYVDLGSLADGGLDASDWDYLARAFQLNGAGQIIGTGLLADMTSGQVAYLLTPTTVPVAPAVWLFGSGLLGLIGIARKK